jgi:hypothetical protein
VRRLFATALVLALGVAVIGTAAVPAGGKIANSKVHISIGFSPGGDGNPFFEGSVKSGRSSCKRNRPVGIFFQRNQGKLRFFKRDRSDENGYYSVPMNQTMRTGGYIARVKPKRGCKKDLSNPIGVGQNGPGGIAP